MKITSAQLFETLVAELEKSPCLAKGFQKGTAPDNFKQQWEAISNKLNALGTPLEDGDGWQKVWRDYKFKVKKKLLKNKAECNATGGGRYKQLPLCPLEEVVANLLQLNKQLRLEGVLQGFQMTPITIDENENSADGAVNVCPLDGAQIIECIQLCPPNLFEEEE